MESGVSWLECRHGSVPDQTPRKANMMVQNDLNDVAGMQAIRTCAVQSRQMTTKQACGKQAERTHSAGRALCCKARTSCRMDCLAFHCQISSPLQGLLHWNWRCPQLARSADAEDSCCGRQADRGMHQKQRPAIDVQSCSKYVDAAFAPSHKSGAKLWYSSDYHEQQRPQDATAGLLGSHQCQSLKSTHARRSTGTTQ